MIQQQLSYCSNRAAETHVNNYAGSMDKLSCVEKNAVNLILFKKASLEIKKKTMNEIK